MGEELKLCPLCGNKEVFFSANGLGLPVVVCDSVECSLIADFDADVTTQKQAAKRWNRRSG
jgi:RNA polymerase subunit RPABC4/transcription elongation factor Spt4